MLTSAPKTGHFARECPEGGEDEREVVLGRDLGRDREVGGGRRGEPRPAGRERTVRVDPRLGREYGAGGGLRCCLCHRAGHFAGRCREEEERCYRCLAPGHTARNCTADGDQPICYNCNKAPHLHSEIPRDGRNLLSIQVYTCGPPDRTHHQGLSECRNQDLLQVRWNWTHSERVPEPKLTAIRPVLHLPSLIACVPDK